MGGGNAAQSPPCKRVTRQGLGDTRSLGGSATRRGCPDRPYDPSDLLRRRGFSWLLGQPPSVSCAVLPRLTLGRTSPSSVGPPLYSLAIRSPSLRLLGSLTPKEIWLPRTRDVELQRDRHLLRVRDHETAIGCVSAQLKATQELLEARLAQAPAQMEASRSDSPPRKVHTREGATDDGMGMATPTAPVPAPSSPRPPPRAFATSSSAERPAKAPSANKRTTSAPPTGDEYPAVVLLRLPIPRTEIAIRKWLNPMLALATSFPQDFEYIVLPFHDYVTLSFRTAKGAAAAAASLRRVGPTFEVAPGHRQEVIVIRNGPPGGSPPEQ